MQGTGADDRGITTWRDWAHRPVLCFSPWRDPALLSGLSPRVWAVLAAVCPLSVAAGKGPGSRQSVPGSAGAAAAYRKRCREYRLYLGTHDRRRIVALRGATGRTSSTEHAACV